MAIEFGLLPIPLASPLLFSWLRHLLVHQAPTKPSATQLRWPGSVTVSCIYRTLTLLLTKITKGNTEMGTGDLSGQVDKNARRLLVTDYTVKVLILFSCFTFVSVCSSH